MSEVNQDREDLRAILAMPEGKRFLWRVLEQCGLYRNPFTGNSTTFYNCGTQAIGQWLLDECLDAHEEATASLIVKSKKMENGDD